MPTSWFLLRHIREALKNGRPELAHPLVRQLTELGHKAAFRYETEVARAYFDRAERHLSLDDVEAAWEDLRQGESLGYTGPEASRIREKLTRLALVQLRAMLEHDSPREALEAVAFLREQGLRHPEMTLIQTCARDWRDAVNAADQGDFTRALQGLETLRPKLPCPPRGLEATIATIREREAVFTPAIERMRTSAQDERWSEVLAACDEVLTSAPENVEARQVRAAAWQGMLGPTVDIKGDMKAVTSPNRFVTPGIAHNAQGESLPRRFLLWFDGVGGFLVCLADRITVGQSGGTKPVDVPISAGLATIHLNVYRDTEGYRIESGQEVLINGEPLIGPTLLPRDALVTLGKTCQFRFNRPTKLSQTAVIRMMSNHRLPEGLDAALLMGESLLLTPAPDGHVQVPELSGALFLVRDGSRLAVQYPGSFCIDGERFQDRGILELNGSGTSVHADEFSFTIEPLPAGFATI